MGDLGDLDFSLSPVKRSTARQGRRARAQEEEEEEEVVEMEGSPLRAREAGLGEALGPRASAPPRRQGGWGEESRARTGRSVYREQVQEQDSEEDLPTIPDLEEVLLLPPPPHPP